MVIMVYADIYVRWAVFAFQLHFGLSEWYEVVQANADTEHVIRSSFWYTIFDL